MEILVFVGFALVVVLIADVHEKYHKREMAKIKGV